MPFRLMCANLGGKGLPTVLEDPTLQEFAVAFCSEVSGKAGRWPGVVVYRSTGVSVTGVAFVVARKWVCNVVGAMDSVVPGGLCDLRFQLGTKRHSIIGVYAPCMQWRAATQENPTTSNPEFDRFLAKVDGCIADEGICSDVVWVIGDLQSTLGTRGRASGKMYARDLQWMAVVARHGLTPVHAPDGGEAGATYRERGEQGGQWATIDHMLSTWSGKVVGSIEWVVAGDGRTLDHAVLSADYHVALGNEQPMVALEQREAVRWPAIPLEGVDAQSGTGSCRKWRKGCRWRRNTWSKHGGTHWNGCLARLVSFGGMSRLPRIGLTGGSGGCELPHMANGDRPKTP